MIGIYQNGLNVNLDMDMALDTDMEVDGEMELDMALQAADGHLVKLTVDMDMVKMVSIMNEDEWKFKEIVYVEFNNKGKGYGVGNGHGENGYTKRLLPNGSGIGIEDGGFVDYDNL
jgi:hypothetical protein